MIQLVFTGSGHFIGQDDVDEHELADSDNIPEHTGEGNIVVIVLNEDAAESVREIFEK